MIIYKGGGKNPRLLPAADNTRVDAQKIPESEYMPQGGSSPKVYSTRDEGLIDRLNRITPGRYSVRKAAQYDRYDQDIVRASQDLQENGETPDPNFIKTIMMIETGMVPRKNSLGYFGFPQTKEHIIEHVNSKYGTNFTAKDMDDPYQAAKFIYYYTKGLKKSQYVNNEEDVVAAYNWGMGNYGKYKRKEAELPRETSDYISLARTMRDHYTNPPVLDANADLREFYNGGRFKSPSLSAICKTLIPRRS